jgi:hypothetical protein
MKETGFHFFDPAFVNAHILHWNKCKKKFRPYNFMEKVKEGLAVSVGR